MVVVFIIFSLLTGYFLGSINGAILTSGLLYKEDIRTKGSGNPGLTNALRVYGKKAAVITLLVDLLKGVVSVLIIRLLTLLLFNKFGSFQGYDCIAAAGAITGHNWPVYFKFKGGKGVLTSFAVFLVIAPIPSLIALGVFILIVALTRYVSLGSMLAALSIPAVIYFLGDALFSNGGLSPEFYLCLFAAVLIIIRHHGNISRLIHGTESKLGDKKHKEK